MKRGFFVSAWLVVMTLFMLIPLPTNAKGETSVEKLCLENSKLLVEINVGQGAQLTRIYGKETDCEYLVRECSLFSARVTNQLIIGGYKQLADDKSADMSLLSAEVKDGCAAIVLEKAGVEYHAAVWLNEDELLIQVEAINHLDEEIIVRIVLPEIEMVKVPGSSSERYAMVPAEINGYGPYSDGAAYGYGPQPDTGVPLSYNAMEVAAVFNEKTGQGIAFYPEDENQAGIQVEIKGHLIRGFWARQIQAGVRAQTPVLHISLLSEGWQQAIDLYKQVNHVDDQVAADIPAWLLESGALYSTKRSGSGACYMALPNTTDLSATLSNFRDLPKLLEEAKSVGTEVLMLVDYYSQADIAGENIPQDWLGFARDYYWNKGDYIPREDLGGEEALIDGIRAVHEEGGKIIVYVEPYILFQYSQLGKTMGEEWGGCQVNGLLDQTYIMNYTMQAANKAWQDKVVEICCHLVRDYDVDGIFLDSVGWQWNRLYYTKSDKIIYSMQEYNEGLLTIVERVRNAIREIKEDAVVISESGSGKMIGRNDGGFTADWGGWGNRTGNNKIVLSPTTYAYPTANLISAGTTVNELNQVFAAGMSLALCDYWLDDAEYIRQLVELRRTYKDALVYGAPSFYATGKSQVGAYGYCGEENELLVVVNAGAASSKQTVDLTADRADSQWTYLLGGDGEIAADAQGSIELRVASGEMVVLKRK